MVIQIINLDKCIKKFGDISGIDFTPELTEATNKVKRTAQELVAVYGGQNTKAQPPYNKNVVQGYLKRNIKSKVDKRNNVGYVYTNVDYAIYQEFGTSRQKGTPFMSPAMNINRAGINSSMEKYIREQLALKVQ